MGSAGGFGNTTATHNGYGAYATGSIYLEQLQTLYVCVGQQAPNHISYAGSWNGGGPSPQYWNAGHHGGAGGGASDIRLVSAGTGSTNWEAGLASRIIVAAGGGGAVSSCGVDSDAGHGGTLTSVNIRNKGYGFAGTYHVNGATQYQGGIGYGTSNGDGSSVASQGLFGEGVTFLHCNGGGGGGWYGGASAYVCGGTGGSSYIKDYPGCNTNYVNYQNSTAGYNIEITNPRMQAAYWNAEGYVRILMVERLD